MKYIGLAFITLLFSCNKESSPEQTLSDLIGTRFKSSSRSEILDLTAGALKEQVESMDEAKLKLFLDSEGLVKGRLKVTHKSCELNKCFLTYILNYKDKRSGDLDFSLEVKKIAEIEKYNESWLVNDISNVKTYINSKKEIRGD